MTANGQVLAISAADQLRERLDDPQVAASLNSLLDHADLLAILLTGLDGLIRRGDTISDSLASAVGEMKGPAAAFSAALPNAAELKSIDVTALVHTLASLTKAMVDATPTLDRLLHSPLVDPAAADVLAELGQALVEGKAANEADPGGPKGIFGLWRVTKDQDVTRGMGFLIQVARAFGRQLPH
ncbi:DUF1641 domain-containing protein [Mycolicibacterium komossense]|uniref:DUF1641 domain-containing protein n=1 Tax=Mycolicibacterium komossense TaxID=1779 RepID=A0ABT3CN23_9MYCO|nr:DUF1641 domain-containing protein [Mycolicibacterium komossense]MCV7230840.1 DUF1641 domain-containing protein [Mycolicibacterium komossense]